MSVHRIRGQDGIVLESDTFLELPKAENKTTTFSERAGMLRYNIPLKSFEGVLEFDDGSVSYRRFANLDDNGKLMSSQLPDSVVSGMRYMGTYSILTDDIDPPLSDVQYNSLPAASSLNSGQYYIVRGIMDSAISHFNTNNPTTSPVTFTPTNPSGQGNWTQIKYYFGNDPLNSSDKVVTFAFSRIVSASVPASNHNGLRSLMTDTELTAAFNSTNNPSAEIALSDGDWIISNGVEQQRLRSTRASITAGQVSFDRTLSASIGRSFKTNAGTAQTVIDNLILNTIRRTGDSMYNDGSTGEGRLALVYGTAAKPSLTFTSPTYDATTNSGMDPTQWTDSGTGLFRQAAGSIGFSSNTLEKVRIENTKVILFQSGTLVGSNPTLQFNSATNTNNVGISGINDTLSFSVKNAEQVKFADGLSTFNGSITVLHNTILGDSSSDTLQVNATSTFSAPVTINAALVTTGTNYFDQNIRIKNGSSFIFVANSAASTGTVGLSSATGTGLDINLSSDTYDVRVMEPGNVRRAVIGKYGVKLPVLNPINNSVGEDGMIAYSPERLSTVQKINGTWINIGAGSIATQNFVISDWVLNGAFYNYTITRSGVLDVRVQELISGSYVSIEVDTITIGATTVTISIPSSTDLRFNGRMILSSSV